MKLKKKIFIKISNNKDKINFRNKSLNKNLKNNNKVTYVA